MGQHGGVLEGCWRCAGGVLEGCWRGVGGGGGVLEGCWRGWGGEGGGARDPDLEDEPVLVLVHVELVDLRGELLALGAHQLQAVLRLRSRGEGRTLESATLES